MTLTITCPAGEGTHPILSPNDLDVECRIQGRLRPAREDAPCCGDYAKCPVWVRHKEINQRVRTVKAAEATRGNRTDHTLSDRDRERA
jgi:hypothetical protein